MEAPLARPPDGDIDRGTTWIILLAIFGFIAITTTIIRLYVRTLNRQLGWDDFFIGLAAITLLVQITFNGLSYHSGNGHHGYYLSKSQVQGAEKWNYVSQFLLFLVICVTKISICLFVLRIKKTGWLKRFLYALIAGLVLTTLPCEIILFAQCRPLHAFWDRKSGTCWNPKAYNNAIWVQVAYSIFSDLACTLLPVVVLWNLKISIRLKLSVYGLMSMGLLATVCAAVRASLSSNDRSPDLTWSLITIDDWATLEETLAISAANLALSRTIILFFRDGPRSKVAKRSYKHESHHTEQPSAFRNKRGRDLSLTARSQESIIPLEETIRKTTDLSITHAPRVASPERAAGSWLRLE